MSLFVTNQLGFDTGLAISNTTDPPIAPQAGTCNLNFYGAGAPCPVPPAPIVPTSAFSLTQAVGSRCDSASFQGYIIDSCNFNYAHGFGFILGGLQPAQSVNPTNTATGYLAMVLGNSGSSGTTAHTSSSPVVTTPLGAAISSTTGGGQ